jgi:hypothetical protein
MGLLPMTMYLKRGSDVRTSFPRKKGKNEKFFSHIYISAFLGKNFNRLRRELQEKEERCFTITPLKKKRIIGYQAVFVYFLLL